MVKLTITTVLILEAPHLIYRWLNMGVGSKAFNLSAFWYTSYGNKIANYVKQMDRLSSVHWYRSIDV